MGTFGDYCTPITIQTPETGNVEKHYFLLRYKINFLYPAFYLCKNSFTLGFASFYMNVYMHVLVQYSI